MTEPTPGHLRIHREIADAAAALDTGPSETVAEFCDHFQQATDWPLRFIASSAGKSDPLWSAPVNPGDGTSPGYLTIGRGQQTSSKPSSIVRLEAAKHLAGAFGNLLGELLQTRRALWQREAELAAGVPVAARPDEPAHLAERLQAVLKGGAAAVGCQAAGLYLLDAATTELKLRASWGLPAEVLVQPARPLQGSLGDLEALTGHAVVLEEASLHEYWRVPETCGSAVCVPVSTSTTLLGTLWMFCKTQRPFSDQQTNLIEIIAGRLAADLEREMLLSEGVASTNLKRQHDSAVRFEHSLWPQTVPELDGWDVAGGTWSACGLGGDFHDWFVRTGGELTVTVGDALDKGTAAALAASGLRAAMRSHAAHEPSPARVMSGVNETLWTGSQGDNFAAAFCGAIDPDTGEVVYSSAGRISAMVLRDDGWEALGRCELPLGIGRDWNEPDQQITLEPGDVLVVFTDGVREAQDVLGEYLGESTLAQALLPYRTARAEKLISIAQGLLADYDTAQDDCTLLIVRRTVRS
ncbi:MAG: GAF domain-containing SpoIIE family protein phosphatase [Pirellulales bacterium]